MRFYAGQIITLCYILSMPFGAYQTIHSIALEQHGIFTAEQARAAGVSPMALVMMAKRGRLERLAHGLYRDAAAPATRWTPYVIAILWPGEVVGVLSHDTALDLMELSDVNPGVIHVTVPKHYRARHRLPPAGVVFHHADLASDEVGSVDGLPVTTAIRTIWDCAASQLGPALLRQAIDDGQTKGWLTPEETMRLTEELTTTGRL